MGNTHVYWKRGMVIFLVFAFLMLPQLKSSAFSPQASQPAAAAAATPVFRFPVVPGAVISGYFDHNTQAEQVTFYNGRKNLSSAYGFYFSCSSPSMYDFVGCENSVGGEASCPNNRELWYDGHKGIDYEYSPNWHTGATCDPARFNGITMKVYAPAAGKVMFAGYDAARPANGWHIRIKHDLNKNGNYEDDNFRSNFLHFTANQLAVSTNDVVTEGQYLGLGGSTGYSSSPHLHFEVQRSSDNFQTSVWSVDPYGWSGTGSDPWPYQNTVLWKANQPHRIYLPAAIKQASSSGCAGCGELLNNRGFEAGKVNWVELGVDIIDNSSYPNLPIMPYAGDWLAWLGGRNNAEDTVYQDFRVPTGLANARLRYAVHVRTTETSGIYDWMVVRLRDTGGSLVQEVDGVDNSFSPGNQWVIREVMIPQLTNRQDVILRLSFEATTDGNNSSSFFLDDISLTALAPGE